MLILIALALAACLVGMFTTMLSMRPVTMYADRWGLVAQPGGRKQHAQSTPETGGISMALGLIVAVLASIMLGWVIQKTIDPLQPVPYLGFSGVAGGAVLLVCLGALDDRFDLHPFVKILLQAVAAIVAVDSFDARIDSVGELLLPASILPEWLLPKWLGMCLSVIALVGAINALNMLDGVDGLAGGMILQILLFVLTLAVVSGYLLSISLLAPIVGVILGFLYFNARIIRAEATVFMGDAGSMLLGYLVAVIVMRYGHYDRAVYPPVIALWLLYVPVVDTLALIVRRMLRKRSPFSSGRDHIHHLLVAMGFSVNQTVLLLVLANACLGFMAWALYVWFEVPEYVLFYLWLLSVGVYILITRYFFMRKALSE